jgi:hypothetical protein
MTAIVYFGEMLVASLLAIVLLAISQLRMSSDAVLFAGGVVALTLAEYLVRRFVLHGFAPIEHRLHHANPDCAVLTIAAFPFSASRSMKNECTLLNWILLSQKRSGPSRKARHCCRAFLI